VEALVWEAVKLKGPKPEGRQDASMVVYRDKLFLFGGKAGATMEIIGDLWCFDLLTNKWKQLRGVGSVKPTARYSHGLWVAKNKLYIFGGQTDCPNASHFLRNAKSPSNLECFDLETNQWECIPNVGDSPWEFGEFVTIPLYNDGEDPSKPSSIVLWGGYFDNMSESFVKMSQGREEIDLWR
jgi:hypothetical protein